MLTLEVLGRNLFGEYRSRLVGNQRFTLDVRRFSLELARQFEELFEKLKRW